MSFRYPKGGFIQLFFDPLTPGPDVKPVYSWGRNNHGQLGDGIYNVDRSSPVQVGSSTDWAEVSVGTDAVIAKKTDGSLWFWGRSSFGINGLNIGTGGSRSSPTQIGALTNWNSISCGTAHAAATKTDGTLWTWGYNNFGQLGLNTVYVNQSSPTQVGSLTTWLKVSANYASTFAIKNDGTLWSWGYNFAGVLGQNNLIYRSSPVQVGALTNWSQIETLYINPIAIKTDGTLWTWGFNSDGELGQNDRIYRSSPVQVGALTTWSKVSGGNYHFIATQTNGTLWTCGANAFGQLGESSTNKRSSPVQVGAGTTWLNVLAASYASGAIKTDGTLWMWGDNTYGQLGLNNVVRRSSPVQVGSDTTWSLGNGGGGFVVVIKNL